MPNVHIVIDSTACLPDDFLKKYDNLHVIPLKVILGDREWPEPEMSCRELFDLSQKSNIFPKTSQPAPGDFAAVFAPLVAAGHEVIVITISSRISGTFNGAKVAAQAAGGKIRVLDSRTTAVGMAKMAEMALAMIQAGHSADEVFSRLQDMADVTHTMIVPKTLDYLHKGGRIGGAAALMGTILQIRPVLYLTEGKVDVLDKARTQGKAVQRMVEELSQYPKLAHIGVIHIEAPEDGAKLAAQVRELYPDVPVSLTTGSPVLATHLGPVLAIICHEVLGDR
ncbi:DegV family protein [Acetonema longum]|uniref:DegV family protein n=1 Tax=Acetonema longum DSM 6540 TaxID=1009370 RepID=F7NFL2_9FIRM|nr:DegV family protein [Acetonema longum]EGO65175.1 degV family protein [Acetonema longum DSM 6540]